MSSPSLKSRRQHIRLWFEFYKLCHRDPLLRANLKSSSDYYREWGDVTNVSFDDWWKSHKHLFGSQVREVSHMSSNPNELTVSIPLNQPVSTTMKDLKSIVEQRQTERLLELGIDPKSVKSLNVGFGQYDFTKGTEVRGKPLYKILLIYTIWIDLEKPAVNTDFCFKVIEWFRSRPRSQWIPFILQLEPQTDRKGNLRFDENQIRQIRRYLRKGEQVCKSVSIGEFPGKSRLV